MNKRWWCVFVLALGLLVIGPGSTGAQTDVTCEDIAPPGVPAAYFVGLGSAYFTQGNFTLSVISYTCAVDLDPVYAPAYVQWGYAYAVQRADPQALEDYNRALELDETLIPAYINRGMLYMSQGNFGLALTDFDLAAALAPDNAVIYHNRALVHAAEGHYDLAITDLQQAITLDPDYAAPHAALGAVYSALALQSYGNYAEIAGPTKRLPAGQPDDIINTLDAGLKNNDFSIWVAFLTPAQ
ncbi:MAG: tetratricopeptide repeat protein [Chloroflexi bacterium]|nr:tetratricopeptide repeat protein [Chloroflexota bacterium]